MAPNEHQIQSTFIYNTGFLDRNLEGLKWTTLKNL